MVKRYPHNCSIIIPAMASKDVNGDFAFDESTIISSVCRVEPASESLKVADNGLALDVKHKVYIPLISETIDNSFLNFFGEKRQIIRAWKYQKHIEIWV